MVCVCVWVGLQLYVYLPHTYPVLQAHEIQDPMQTDLKATDAVIVDSYHGLHVWVGPIARQIDMKAAIVAGKACFASFNCPLICKARLSKASCVLEVGEI